MDKIQGIKLKTQNQMGFELNDDNDSTMPK